MNLLMRLYFPNYSTIEIYQPLDWIQGVASSLPAISNSLPLNIFFWLFAAAGIIYLNVKIGIFVTNRVKTIRKWSTDRKVCLNDIRFMQDEFAKAACKKVVVQQKVDFLVKFLEGNPEPMPQNNDQSDYGKTMAKNLKTEEEEEELSLINKSEPQEHTNITDKNDIQQNITPYLFSWNEYILGFLFGWPPSSLIILKAKHNEMCLKYNDEVTKAEQDGAQYEELVIAYNTKVEEKESLHLQKTLAKGKLAVNSSSPYDKTTVKGKRAICRDV